MRSIRINLQIGLTTQKIGGKAVEGLFVIAGSAFVQFEYVSELSRPRRRVATPTARMSKSK